MLTHTLNLSWQAPGGTTIPCKVTVQGDAEHNLDFALTVGQTQQVIGFDINPNQLKSLYLLYDGADPVSLSFGSGTTHADITLQPNEAFVWYDGMGAANPIPRSGVTEILVTKTSGDSGTVKVRALANL